MEEMSIHNESGKEESKEIKIQIEPKRSESCELCSALDGSNSDSNNSERVQDLRIEEISPINPIIVSEAKLSSKKIDNKLAPKKIRIRDSPTPKKSFKSSKRSEKMLPFVKMNVPVRS